nr:hypothetical protein [Tanacetum cinerariifolium]
CGFDGLSSPDKSLSSQTRPDDPDLLNDISDLVRRGVRWVEKTNEAYGR